MASPGPSRSPKGAVLCTVLNACAGLLTGGLGILLTLGALMATAQAPEAAGFVATGFMCDMTLSAAGMGAGAIWCIVGLARHSRALVTGLKIATISAAIGIPSALLPCLAVVGLSAESENLFSNDEVAPMAFVVVVMLGLGICAFAPIPLFVLNLLAFRRARKAQYFSDRDIDQVFG